MVAVLYGESYSDRLARPGTRPVFYTGRQAGRLDVAGRTDARDRSGERAAPVGAARPGLGSTRAEFAAESLGVFHVVSGGHRDGRDLFLCQFADHFRGGTEYQDAVGKDLAFCDQGVGTDDAVATDLRTVQHRARDTDERVVADAAAVQPSAGPVPSPGSSGCRPGSISTKLLQAALMTSRGITN